MSRPALPHAYRSVTPYLSVRGAAQAIEFYVRAFGMQERARIPWGPGLIGHAELRFGDSFIMLADEMPQAPVSSPASLGASSCSLLLYCDDVDALYAQALAAGCSSLSPPTDQFYGDRSASLRCPYGHIWTLATHVEDVGAEELARRIAGLSGSC